MPFAARENRMVMAYSPLAQGLLGGKYGVDNRPGGGTTIGLKAVMTAKPDGYTLLYTNTPTHVIAQLVARGFTYDPIKDFVPIVTVGSRLYSNMARPLPPPGPFPSNGV